MVKPGFFGTPIIEDRHGNLLKTLTEGQDKLLNAIENNDIIFVNGPAGTGKTAVAVWYGISKIDAGIYNKLVLTRPVIEAGEELGFLPGTFEEKISPYMQPIYDSIELIKGKPDKVDKKPSPILETNNFGFSQRVKKDKKKKKTSSDIECTVGSNLDFYSCIHVCPLAYMRGTTKAKSFILLDEAQNATASQMKMMLTRLGRGSKLVITGDINQSDLTGKTKSGFREAHNILRGIKGIAFVKLTEDDIVRHRLIKDIILRYEHPSVREDDKIDDPSVINDNANEDIRDYHNFDFS